MTKHALLHLCFHSPGNNAKTVFSSPLGSPLINLSLSSKTPS